MPITTQPEQVELYGGDDDHWTHVMESIHVPAVKAAGFRPIRPVTSGTQMIMGEIIKHLSKADMVLCDLSGHNPNVFFELGVRTSLNLPIALVKDEHTKIPFDTSGLNTHQYVSTLHAWHTDDQITAVRRHIEASSIGADGKNPMWQHFGLEITADRPKSDATSTDARIDLIFERVNELSRELRSQKQDPLLTQGNWYALHHSAGPAQELAAAWMLHLPLRLDKVRPLGPHSAEMFLGKTGRFQLSPEHHARLDQLAKQYGYAIDQLVEIADEVQVRIEEIELD
jgi:hypothetical protein